MKRLFSKIIFISCIILSITSCEKKFNSIEENVLIENHSSSHVSGAFNMGLSTFDLAPGEVYSTTLYAREKGFPDVSQVTIAGPRDLAVDGKHYVLKSTAPANGFFELYGWDVTQDMEVLNFKLELTDDGLAEILAQADIMEETMASV